jgi:hypothetical protein
MDKEDTVNINDGTLFTSDTLSGISGSHIVVWPAAVHDPAHETFEVGDKVKITEHCAFKKGTVVEIVEEANFIRRAYLCTYDGVHLLEVHESKVEKLNGIEAAKNRHGL